MPIDLELSNAGTVVQMTLTPDSTEEMETFARYFGETASAVGSGGYTQMLEIVRVTFSRADFRERLKPLGLTDSGGSSRLEIASVTASTADAAFRCRRTTATVPSNDCENLAVPDYNAAVLACNIVARSRNWLGGQAENGSCSSRGSATE